MVSEKCPTWTNFTQATMSCDSQKLLENAVDFLISHLLEKTIFGSFSPFFAVMDGQNASESAFQASTIPMQLAQWTIAQKACFTMLKNMLCRMLNSICD